MTTESSESKSNTVAPQQVWLERMEATWREDTQRTHWDGCEFVNTHHRCAIQRLIALAAAGSTAPEVREAAVQFDVEGCAQAISRYIDLCVTQHRARSWEQIEVILSRFLAAAGSSGSAEWAIKIIRDKQKEWQEAFDPAEPWEVAEAYYIDAANEIIESLLPPVDEEGEK